MPVHRRMPLHLGVNVGMRTSVLCTAGMLAATLLGVDRRLAAQSVRIDPQPVRILAGSAPDGTPVFGRVAGATRLADGTIAIGDASGNALKFFDEQGHPTRTVGRQGQGPGEFGQLGRVMQCGRDSVFAFDVFGRRVSVFSASGAFVRQFQMPGGGAGMKACSQGGTLAFLRSSEATQPPEGVAFWYATAPLVAADTRGTVIRELGHVLAYEIAASGHGWLPRPGGPGASVAVGTDRVFVCPTEASAVAVYSLTGAGNRSLPLRVPPRAPSRRFLERVADAGMMSMPPGPMRDTLRQRLLRIPAPAQLPPCSKILTDPGDNLWVVLSFPGDSVTTLRVFSRDDRLLGDVSIPAALEVLEIGSNYLLASGETAEGEPWVRMYNVRRRPAR